MHPKKPWYWTEHCRSSSGFLQLFSRFYCFEWFSFCPAMFFIAVKVRTLHVLMQKLRKSVTSDLQHSSFNWSSTITNSMQKWRLTLKILIFVSYGDPVKSLLNQSNLACSKPWNHKLYDHFWGSHNLKTIWKDEKKKIRSKTNYISFLKRYQLIKKFQ